MPHHNQKIEQLADDIAAALAPLGLRLVEDDGMRVRVNVLGKRLRVVLEADELAAGRLER